MWRRSRWLARRGMAGPIPWVVGVPLGVGPRRRLATAHRLMDQGKYEDAAKIFEDLAQGALRAGLPRAPQLLLQAARARLLASEVPEAVSLAQEGLSKLAQMQRWRILDRAGNGVVAELRRLGHTDEADELATWLSTLLKGHENTSWGGQPSAPRRLPTKCPHCGGSVRSDEVEWIDEGTAECSYCGSPIGIER